MRKYLPEWRKKNPDKVREYQKKSNSKWNKENKSDSWTKKRFSILERFNFTCMYCGRKPPEVILEVDHIHPRSKGGKNEKENLTVACRECNVGKSNTIISLASY